MATPTRHAICYIDGFNLYHAIADLHLPHLKWLNLSDLSQTLLRQHQNLFATRYFSAYATWRDGPYRRHQAYTAALEAAGVDVVMAHFKERRAKCRSCDATWVEHEEKETDVHLAVRLLADAEDHAADDLVLITADSDLVPPIRLVKSRHPDKRIIVAAPPGRFGHGRSLRAEAHSYFEITKGRLKRSLFDREVYGGDGTLAATRPSDYAPPV